MNTDFVCEVCGNRSSRLLGTRDYTRGDCARADAYRTKRLRVLFDTWCPGVDEIRFKAVMCQDCGFVSHLPRAESTDLDAKYRVLAALGQDYGKDESELVATKRSKELYAAVATAVRHQSPLRVLDYGGGDGRLMRSFTRNGHETFLVDYNAHPIPSVRKLADTLDALPAGSQFDLIVASHVLEHVAQPSKVVRQLARHLRHRGHLFVEVPMEIWGRPPFHDEPVTHVNFFVRNSLQRTLEEAGLTLISSGLTRSLHPSGKFRMAVRALAQNCGESIPPHSTGVVEVNAFLQPSVIQRLRRRSLLAGGVFGLTSHAVARRIGRMSIVRN